LKEQAPEDAEEDQDKNSMDCILTEIGRKMKKDMS